MKCVTLLDWRSRGRYLTILHSVIDRVSSNLEDAVYDTTPDFCPEARSLRILLLSGRLLLMRSLLLGSRLLRRSLRSAASTAT